MWKVYKYILFIILLISAGSAIAQMQECTLLTGNNNSTAAQILSNHKGYSVELEKIVEKKSPYATYITYTQLWNGIAIYNAQIKQCIPDNASVSYISGNYYDTRQWTASSVFNKIQKLPAAIAVENNLPPDLSGTCIIIPDTSGNIAFGYIYTYQKDADRSQITLICSADGNVMFTDDHKVYYSGTDSLVSGKVFLPDPVSAAAMPYGGELADNDDADNTTLNSLRSSVFFKTYFSGDTFYLQNENIRIKDLAAPNVAVVNVLIPEFNFTRDQQGFEDVNTFYHLSNFANYIVSLGYTSLQDFYLEADPHGASGADQSFFVGGAIPSIQYGEGGVDDAEDADVLVHEYVHALSNNAAPASNSGFERRAIDEGYGDYFAASYSRQFSDYNYSDVFNWDGHNEFWSGRNVNSSKVYPEDLSATDIYYTSEIWSGALMDIQETLGMEVADKLVCETMYQSAINMSMPTAALHLLNAELIVFGGVYQSTVYDLLDARGLIEATAIENSTAENAAISISNTYGFTYQNSPLHIETPSPEDIAIYLYDVSGKLLDTQVYFNQNSIDYMPQLQSGGIFLLEVKCNELSGKTILIKLR